MRDVLDLIFEFLISILVIGGGGILMVQGKGDNTFSVDLNFYIKTKKVD